MTLLPVGTAAAFGGVDEAQSAYLIRVGDRRILFDLGSGALAALAAHMPPENLDLVVISHLHPDHCVDLLGLRVHIRWGPGMGRTLPVLGPPRLPERLAAFSGEARWEDADGLRFAALAPGGGERDLGDGLRLRHREVPHLPPTHALRLDHRSGAFCYGADCAPSSALVELASGCDLLLAECAFGAEAVPDGVAHLNGALAGRLAAEAGVGRLLLTHCQFPAQRARAAAAAREFFAGPVEWAQPGVEIAL